MTKLRDIVSDAVPVPPSASIVEVAWEMRSTGTGVVAVCRDRNFYGLITERDIVLSIIANAYNPKRVRVRSLLNNEQPSVSPEAEIGQVAKIMADNNIQALPVVEKGRLLGLVTLGDLAEQEPELAAMVLSKTIRLQRSSETKVYQGVV